jgi:high-affinity iron transporter
VLAAFVVLFREGFEASLLVAIVLAYLSQTGHGKERRQVWYGVGAAIAVSLGLSGFLFATVGELEGPAEKIFEACALFLAVGFLTYMVLWMRRESRALAGTSGGTWIVLSEGVADLRLPLLSSSWFCARGSRRDSSSSA